MRFLTKIMVIMSLASVLVYGTDSVQFKNAFKDMKEDYKKAGISVKKMVRNEPVDSTEVTKEIKAIDQDINNLLDSFDFNNVKDEVTSKFITLTDFIFNGTEIKGVKFEDLTSTSKEVVMDTYNVINKKIKEKYPNYQEVVSEKVEAVKETAGSVKEYAKEKVVEAIGEDNYNSAKEKVTETKDKVVEKTKETYNTAKDKVKGWYNNLKEKVS